MPVTFRVLGSVEALRDGEPVELSGKPLTVLACLLVRANSTVSVDALVAALWDEENAHGKGAVQTYVRRLRRALGAEVVRTQGSGYRIDAGPDDLDVLRFQALTAQGDAAAADGDHATAASRYGEAVALWRGPALDNVDSGVLHREDVSALSEQRLAVWQRWADAQLRRGVPPIAELTRLTGEHPMHEPFWEQLMTALHQAGRTADALAAYRKAGRVLADELGLDPGPALQRLHQAILTGEPPAPAPHAAASPRQLSAAIDGFSGRGDELAQLTKLLAAGTDRSAVIAAIEGTAGVGKTTLAVRFAHEVADEFPDGHLQLNLRGYGPGQPLAPSAALESLLRSVGAGPELPAELDARAAAWRTHTSGRKVLILLDNARSSDQVRPLLPGPGCLVLVTSRSRLPGLTARDGAGRVSLERLREADAVDLLGKTVGAHRVHADPAASRRFVARCAFLPLAIRILAEYAEQQPERPLADIVDEVSAGPDRLAYFDLDDGDDTNLRAIFDRSYAALDDETARLFRLLGRHPGREFGAYAAAALGDLRVDETRRVLDRLVRANLLEQHRPGRYEFHDLLREFAASLDEPAADDAVVRVIDWYLHAALLACEQRRPGWTARTSLPPPVRAASVLPSMPDAMQWYGLELDNLLAVFEVARARGLDAHVCHLALALRPYFTDVPLQDGWFATHQVGLESARAVGDRRAEGRLLCGLGLAHAMFGALESAVSYCEAAVEVARELGELDDESTALNNVAFSFAALSDHDRAIEASTRALAVAERIGDAGYQSVARVNIVGAYVDRGQFEAAAPHVTAMRASLDQLDARHKSMALVNIASVEAGLGEYESSEANYQAALELFHADGWLLGEADALIKLGDLHARIGHAALARSHREKALDILTRLGHRDAERVRRLLDSPT